MLFRSSGRSLLGCTDRPRRSNWVEPTTFPTRRLRTLIEWRRDADRVPELVARRIADSRLEHLAEPTERRLVRRDLLFGWRDPRGDAKEVGPELRRQARRPLDLVLVVSEEQELPLDDGVRDASMLP